MPVLLELLRLLKLGRAPIAVVAEGQSLGFELSPKSQEDGHSWPSLPDSERETGKCI